jgi:hypothetical protein
VHVGLELEGAPAQRDVEVGPLIEGLLQAGAA